MSIDAMKQALDALSYVMSHGAQVQIAKDVLRQAIEQAQVVSNDTSQERVDITAKKEHEPVAWRNAALRVGEDLCSVGPFGYYDMTAEQWLDWALSVVTVHAPPPPRHLEPVIDKSAAIRIATALGWTPPRQPLSDGEIYTAYITATNQTLRAQDERLAFAFARAIEAACIKGEV